MSANLLSEDPAAAPDGKKGSLPSVTAWLESEQEASKVSFAVSATSSQGVVAELPPFNASATLSFINDVMPSLTAGVESQEVVDSETGEISSFPFAFKHASA